MVAVALLVGSLGGCKPKAGGSCNIEAKEVCVDGQSALACHDGKWEAMPCLGPDGCSKRDAQHTCDQSVAEAGDACNVADDHACTRDDKAMLKCVKGRWTVVQSCLGERACTMDKKEERPVVTCDDSVANVGDACREEEDYACSPDKKAALVCRKSQFVQASLCKGPQGCRVVGSKEGSFKVECDDSVASPGDACENEEHFSCAADERTILKCRNKTFEIEEKCKSKEKCQIKGGLVGCY